MTTRVRFCLSYDPLKRDFIAFELNIISLRKFIADTDVVNEATRWRQSVITRQSGHTIFMTRLYPLNTATSYDKCVSGPGENYWSA